MRAAGTCAERSPRFALLHAPAPGVRWTTASGSSTLLELDAEQAPTEVPTIQLPPPAGATIIMAVVTDTTTGKPQVLVGGVTHPKGHRTL